MAIYFQLTSKKSNEIGLTKSLQKGLTLYKNEQSLCEEGMGFGVPSIIKNNQTYLSFTSEINTINSSSFQKVFKFDALERIKYKGKEITNPYHYLWVEFRGKAYKKIKPIQRLLPIWYNFHKKSGFEFYFKKVVSQLNIAVEFHLNTNLINIQIDLSEYKKQKNKIKLYILNELGANYFPFYHDSNGLSLYKEKISGWAKVKADKACFISKDMTYCFSLTKKKNADLYRGWEYIPKSISWAGLIYDLTKYNQSKFNYSIELEDNKSSKFTSYD